MTLAELQEHLAGLMAAESAPVVVENEFGDPLLIDEVYAHKGRVVFVVKPAKRPLGPIRT